jgi:hypothetical protein
MIVGDAPTNLSSTKVTLLVEDLERNTERFMKRVEEGVKVGRSPDEAILAGVRETVENLTREQRTISESVLDVSWKQASDPGNSAGVNSVVVHLGDMHLNPFESIANAHSYAKHAYGLPDNTYSIKQNGVGGYTIALERPVDETTPAFRKALATSENTQETSFASTFLGRLRSGDDRVSKFQRENRVTAIHQKSGFDEVVKGFVKDIGRLSSKHMKELGTVINRDKFEINPALSKLEGKEIRGVFRETIDEFERAFYSAHNKFPSEQQTRAYFTHKTLSDIDYTLRNLQTYRCHSFSC